MRKNNIRQLAERVLDINHKHYRLFSSPEEYLKRRAYREIHPTEIMVGKCMDGRLNLAVMTETPMGIIQPCRNIGGIFDLGWMAFQLMVAQWVDYSISRGRKCVFLATYHFSKGDKHRGCAGHNYDTDEAKKAAAKLKAQFDRVFGRSIVTAILCGVETDAEALIFHGENGDVWDLSTVINPDPLVLSEQLRRMYPQMDSQVLQDLLPLIEGNIRHTREISASNRPVVEMEHMEWILGIGRGFDWLHKHNQALIVGPFDLKIAKAIETAGKLLLGNIEAGRNKFGGAVLVTAALYRNEVGPEPLLAMEKARSLRDFSLEILEEKVPDLLPRLEVMAGSVDINTRQFTPLADNAAEMVA